MKLPRTGVAVRMSLQNETVTTLVMFITNAVWEAPGHVLTGRALAALLRAQGLRAGQSMYAIGAALGARHLVQETGPFRDGSRVRYRLAVAALLDTEEDSEAAGLAPMSESSAPTDLIGAIQEGARSLDLFPKLRAWHEPRPFKCCRSKGYTATDIHWDGVLGLCPRCSHRVMDSYWRWHDSQTVAEHAARSARLARWVPS